MKKIIAYKTFDELMADVTTDLRSYSLSGLIDPQELIRVVRMVTKDLGLRIYKTKEVALELHNGKVRLPEDYYTFNFALLADSGSKLIVPPQGVSTTVVPYPQVQAYQDAPPPAENCKTYCGTSEQQPCGQCEQCTPTLVISPGHTPLKLFGNPCQAPRVFLDCKGDAMELVQIVNAQVHRWKRLIRLYLIDSPGIPESCPNRYAYGCDKIWVKDRFLHSDLECGTIYLNYEGVLEDEEGNLLVVDVPKLTEYYEYAVKVRIFENLYLNGEDVQQRLQFLENKLLVVKDEARKIVKTPNFSELHEMWKLNRRAFNSRYVDMFAYRNFWGLDPANYAGGYFY